MCFLCVSEGFSMHFLCAFSRSAQETALIRTHAQCDATASVFVRSTFPSYPRPFSSSSSSSSPSSHSLFCSSVPFSAFRSRALAPRPCTCKRRTRREVHISARADLVNGSDECGRRRARSKADSALDPTRTTTYRDDAPRAHHAPIRGDERPLPQSARTD